MKIVFCVFVVLYLITVRTVSSLQSCADFKAFPMNGFIKYLYAGDWFIYQQSTTNNPGSLSYNCFVQIRTPLPNGNQALVEVLVDPGVLPELKLTGVSVFDQPGKGHYILTTNAAPSGSVTILDTDYVTYSIEFACQDLSGGGSRVHLLILSRLPTVTSFTKEKIHQVLKAHNLDTIPLQTLNILSCPSQLQGSGGLLAGILALVTNLLGLVLGLLG